MFSARSVYTFGSDIRSCYPVTWLGFSGVDSGLLLLESTGRGKLPVSVPVHQKQVSWFLLQLVGWPCDWLLYNTSSGKLFASELNSLQNRKNNNNVNRIKINYFTTFKSCSFSYPADLTRVECFSLFVLVFMF